MKTITMSSFQHMLTRGWSKNLYEAIEKEDLMVTMRGKPHFILVSPKSHEDMNGQHLCDADKLTELRYP